uniref:CHAP domain-containing protein n=1 Tax=Agathobacter sp. TaxID=2021311 RepID=UPI0040561C9E
MAKLNELFAKNASYHMSRDGSIFRSWYYGDDKANVPWNAIFISYVANKTNILNELVPKCELPGDFARIGVAKKWGKFYKRGTTTPKVGDIVCFSLTGQGNKDIYHCDCVGIVHTVTDGYMYVIQGDTDDMGTAPSVVVNFLYKFDDECINGYYRPNWKKLSAKPDALYCVRAGGKWYPFVKNLEDYAGVRGIPITDVAIKFSAGTCKYRVHVKGSKWLPWVTGCDLNDYENGYAGNGKEIDAIQITYKASATLVKHIGKHKVQYRVSPCNRNYYPYQTGIEKTDGQDGFAGLAGVSIDRLQITLE